MVRNLRRGDRGPDVKAVQEALNLRRPKGRGEIGEDGAFGAETDAAVRRFQGENALTPDGIVGPLTRAKLFPIAVVSARAIGMRLQMPDLRFPPSRVHSGPFGGGLQLGDPSSPPILPPITPLTLNPTYGPLRYPSVPLPLQTPPLTPPPQFGFPIHHFELAPGFAGNLLGGRRIGGAFSLSLSAIAVIGDEDLTHNEISTGLLTSQDDSGWSVSWMTQITHVHQLNRAGNFSWQPNAQLLAPFGSAGPPSLSLSPLVFQWDATDRISFSVAGPGASIALDPNNANVSLGLGSLGFVVKFGGDEKPK
jgi:hypothetical protein